MPRPQGVMNLSPTEDKLCGQSSWSPSESSSGRASFSNGNCAERFAQKELAQQIVCDENAEEEVVAPSDSDEPAQPGPEKVIPANEAERLAALNSLGLAFDNAPDPRFDSITTLMKSIFQTPVSAITLIREDAIYMHSRAGQWACTAPRKGSFCDFVLDGACARMVIVEDALADDRFKVNRFVAGPPHVRFYAGAPLVGRSGERYGTLCVIDFVPRKFTSEQYQIVANFAEVATRELERQRPLSPQQLELCAAFESAPATSPPAAPPPRVLRAIDAVEEPVILADMSQQAWPLLYTNEAWAAVTGQRVINDPAAQYTFWEVFGGRAVDMAEVATAVNAVRAGQSFMLSVRSSNPDSNEILTLKFKPATEPGLLGVKQMPTVGIPAGIGLDMRALVGDQAADGFVYDEKDYALPKLGRPHFQMDRGLNGHKKAALAAALAALGGQPTHPACMANIDCAAAAAAVMAEASQHQAFNEEILATPPVYYLGVVCTGAESRQRTSGEFNNEAGVRLSSESASDGSTKESVWDSASSQGVPSSAKAPKSKPKWTVMCLEGAAPPVSVEQPPPPVRDLTLGPMIGCGSIGRCYRGAWNGARVAVKVADYWDMASAVGPGTGLPPAAAGMPSAVVSPSGGAFAASGDAVASGLAATTTLAPALGLDHPNLVQTFAAAVATHPEPQSGRVHHQVWLVQKFADHGCLLDGLDKGTALRCTVPGAVGDGARTVPDVNAILVTAIEVASAMAFLHSRGMVHGALHSRNVLLCSDATDRVRGWSAVVGDYGLVRGCAADAASASENRMALLASASCVAHMAPDVLLGGPVSWESDVYSFGVLLWEMWSGRKAWRNLSPVNVMHAVALEGCTLPLPANAPQGLLGLMAKCLDTGRRPPFPEIVEDLNRQLAAQNVGA